MDHSVFQSITQHLYSDISSNVTCLKKADFHFHMIHLYWIKRWNVPGYRHWRL